MTEVVARRSAFLQAADLGRALYYLPNYGGPDLTGIAIRRNLGNQTFKEGLLSDREITYGLLFMGTESEQKAQVVAFSLAQLLPLPYGRVITSR